MMEEDIPFFVDEKISISTWDHMGIQWFSITNGKMEASHSHCFIPAMDNTIGTGRKHWNSILFKSTLQFLLVRFKKLENLSSSSYLKSCIA